MAAVVIGIETPNEDSLRETGKRQNIGRDLAAHIGEFLAHGVAVCPSFIVGFDADGPDIFERQRAFIETLPAPIVTINVLVAPRQTPLHARMRREGRLVGEDWQVGCAPAYTNIVPKQMSRDELCEGVRRLCAAVYAPEAFEQRVMKFMAAWRSPGPRAPIPPGAARVRVNAKALVRKFARTGPGEAQLCDRILAAVRGKPVGLQMEVTSDLIRYIQIRYMYEETGVMPRSLALRQDAKRLASPPWLFATAC